MKDPNVHNPAMDDRLIRLESRASFPSRGWPHYWLASAAFAVAALLALQFDGQVASYNNFGNFPGDARRILQLSEFFAHGFGVFVIAWGIWFLAAEKRAFIPRIVACAIWPGMVVQGIKHLVSRTRPGKMATELPESELLSDSGPASWNSVWNGFGDKLNSMYETQSFPSGHTATAVGLAIGLSWVFPKGKYFFWALAALSASQRITSDAHWISDVLAGAAVGILCAGAVTQDWGVGRWLGNWESASIRKMIDRGVLADPSNDLPRSESQSSSSLAINTDSKNVA